MNFSASLNTTDSSLLGRNVVDIEVTDTVELNFEQIENEIITKWHPVLINTFLPINHVKAIA